MSRSPRLAVRGILVREGRVLMVNAFAGSDALWCLPGGGVEAGADLADNLVREVFEETGLRVTVGDLAHVSEFADPDTGFHQVELFFHVEAEGDVVDTIDPVVSHRGWFDAARLAALPHKPDTISALAFGPRGPATCAPLSRMVRV
ncbi:MAG: NUDIX hydrolase [Pseudomonadota bacterium]